MVRWRVPEGEVPSKDKKAGAAVEPNKPVEADKPSEGKEGVKAKRPRRKKEWDEPKDAAVEPNKNGKNTIRKSL